MSENTIKLRNFDRSLWMRFLDRCHDEGKSPTEVMEAWVRRAIRQERSVLPLAQVEDGTVLQMRRAR